MRTVLLPAHIIAGLIAIATGFVALYALKGAKLHRQSGKIFAYAMLVMAGCGVALAVMKSQPGNIVGGSITLYLVTTGVLTLRRRDENSLWIDTGAMVAAILIGSFSLWLGINVWQSPSGKIDGVPPQPILIFGAVALLAAAGDLRMILARGLQGSQRIARHLWRMCFAMFIATGSFFLGQAKVFPKPVRIIPLLAIPVVLVLVTMFYWMVRVSLTRWYSRQAIGTFKPITLGRSTRRRVLEKRSI